MAGFRELPLIVNVLLAVAVAVLVVGGGLYIPGSPLQSQRLELEKAIADEAQLTQEVQALQVYKRKHAELQADIAAQQKQLETLRTIVPEEKEVDEFIRMIHTAAASSNVELRRLTAKPVGPKEFYYEMPFEIEFDGPYFNVWNFFAKLGRLSRIVNVSDLAFMAAERHRQEKGQFKYPIRPGTSVLATCTVTTFFTKSTEPEPAKAGKPGKQPGKP